MDGRLRFGWVHLVRAAVVLSLAVSLVIPDFREFQLLTLRLLLRLPGARTFVQGQPAGCVLYIVPNVHFTEPYRRKRVADAATSPDAFLLARYCGYRGHAFPAVSTWNEHALLEWGAITVASHATEPGVTFAAGPPQLPSVGQLKEALSIVRLALQAHPDNSALFAAEALLQFELGGTVAGIDALASAVEHTVWDEQRAAVVRQLCNQLGRHDLPAFDAMLGAHGFTGLSPLSAVMHRNRNHLDRLMARAVREGNEAEFRELASLWLEFVKSETIQPRWWVRSLAANATELPAAAAERLGRTLPPRAEYRARREAEEGALQDYISARLTPEVTRMLLRPDEPTPQMKQSIEERRRRGQMAFGKALKTSIPASFSLLLMALLIGAGLIELPFLVRRNRPAGQLVRTWIFRCCLGVMGVKAAALMFFALDSVFQPVGMRAGPVTNPIAEQLAMGLGFAFVLVVFRLLLQQYPGVRLTCFAALWGAYLSLAGITVAGRCQAIQALSALHN